jgi:hypothetical protein
MVLGHLLPSIQRQFFLEWTRVSFEVYTILLEEHLQVALEMLVVGILVSKIDQGGSIMFRFGDC